MPTLDQIKKTLLAVLAALGIAFALAQAVVCNVPGAESYCGLAGTAATVVDDVSADVEAIEE